MSAEARLRAKADATKQSSFLGAAKMDCFAEPVIGRRFAPTRWLAMTLINLAIPSVLPACDKLTRRIKFRLTCRANHLYDSRHPVPEEGALAIVTERWDGMWWTQRHRARDGIAGRDKLRERLQDVLTSGAEAYGKIVWT